MRPTVKRSAESGRAFTATARVQRAVVNRQLERPERELQENARDVHVRGGAGGAASVEASCVAMGSGDVASPCGELVKNW